jgi:hypothetical protein
MGEQEYQFIDKTGHCFEDFQDKDDGSGYNDRVGAMMRGGCKFGVGDMLVFKDELIQAGFKWGIDFYVKKEELEE